MKTLFRNKDYRVEIEFRENYLHIMVQGNLPYYGVIRDYFIEASKVYDQTQLERIMLINRLSKLPTADEVLKAVSVLPKPAGAKRKLAVVNGFPGHESEGRFPADVVEDPAVEMRSFAGTAEAYVWLTAD